MRNVQLYINPYIQEFKHVITKCSAVECHPAIMAGDAVDWPSLKLTVMLPPLYGTAVCNCSVQQVLLRELVYGVGGSASKQGAITTRHVTFTGHR